MQKTPSLAVQAIRFKQAASLTKAQKNIMSGIAFGRVFTYELHGQPLAKLAELGLVTIGKRVKLTGKGKPIARICYEHLSGIVDSEWIDVSGDI